MSVRTGHPVHSNDTPAGFRAERERNDAARATRTPGRHKAQRRVSAAAALLDVALRGSAMTNANAATGAERPRAPVLPSLSAERLLGDRLSAERLEADQLAGLVVLEHVDGARPRSPDLEVG